MVYVQPRKSRDAGHRQVHIAFFCQIQMGRNQKLMKMFLQFGPRWTVHQ